MGIDEDDIPAAEEKLCTGGTTTSIAQHVAPHSQDRQTYAAQHTVALRTAETTIRGLEAKIKEQRAEIDRVTTEATLAGVCVTEQQNKILGLERDVAWCASSFRFFIFTGNTPCFSSIDVVLRTRTELPASNAQGAVGSAERFEGRGRTGTVNPAPPSSIAIFLVIHRDILEDAARFLLLLKLSTSVMVRYTFFSWMRKIQCESGRRVLARNYNGTNATRRGADDFLTLGSSWDLLGRRALVFFWNQGLTNRNNSSKIPPCTRGK
ncbi:hypothetical protein C8F04DRAFT_99139 [Mycena alexandri]|uniref:Uncharacterized protein n=1 Tax=Mycena alexandri TaxID=1745969 RepID=A0AAD6SHN0_9AGAR|nr:hypothetical protein C8F04DRAFT_99139 [Mycena alexandri]